jgi:hypothetical protein
MAFSDLAIVGGDPQGNYGQIGSGRGVWVVAVADATVALTGETEPQTLTGNSNLIKVGDNGRRILLRCRVTDTTPTSVTAPAVYVYGLFGDNFQNGFGHFSVARVDNADPAAAAVSVPINGTPGTANCTAATVDGVAYLYGPVISLDGIDLKGASYALVVVATAGAVTSGSLAVEALVID